MASRWVCVRYAVEGRKGTFVRDVELEDVRPRNAAELRADLERLLSVLEGAPVGVGSWVPRWPR